MPYAVLTVHDGKLTTKAGLFRTREDASQWCHDHDPVRHAPVRLDWHESTGRQFTEHTAGHLRSVGRCAAKQHGHTLGRFRADETRYGVWWAACRICQRGITIAPRPRHGEPEISGDALAQHCTPVR